MNKISFDNSELWIHLMLLFFAYINCKLFFPKIGVRKSNYVTYTAMYILGKQ